MLVAVTSCPTSTPLDESTSIFQLGYDTYVLHLRHALATVGVPDEEAQVKH